jgi:hypothetical protein
MEAELKRKYREAAHAKLRLQDRYIEGLSDDEQAQEAQEWHDEFTPSYEASAAEIQFDDEITPF